MWYRRIVLVVGLVYIFIGCKKEDEVTFTGNNKGFKLFEPGTSEIVGSVVFQEQSNQNIAITVVYEDSEAGKSYPAAIVSNTAVEGGDFLLSLANVNGTSRKSISYANTINTTEVLNFDYVIHADAHVVILSSDSVLLAEGDIGLNELTGRSHKYDLFAADISNISGSALFEERVNGEALATVSLSKVSGDTAHPVHIHSNTAAETGDILRELNPIPAQEERSRSNLDTLSNGTLFGYAEVLAYDGYLDVHRSATDNLKLVSGDIGVNELTGNKISYEFAQVNNSGVTGLVTFEERLNGESQASISVVGTTPGVSHPAHIHFNTAAETGTIAFAFTDINSTKGTSKSNLAQLTNGGSLMFEDIMDFDGYINIHKSAAELNTVIAQVDIGQNKLTGNSKAYALQAKDIAGITGVISFHERLNNETLVALQLSGSTFSGGHPAAILDGSVTAPSGNVVVILSDLGANGRSYSNVNATIGGSPLPYTQLISYNGYIQVYETNDNSVVMAQGNIGAN